MRVAGVTATAAAVVALAGCSGSPSTPAAPASSSGSQTSPGHPAPTKSARPAGTPHPHSATIPAGGSVPAKFHAMDFTAISGDTWWLLGRAPCAAKPCTSIVRTTDGGAHFVGLPAPRAPLSTGGPHKDGVTQIRFADADDGYAFDPGLWVTQDGGGHWSRGVLSGHVETLAIGGGRVFAVVDRGTRGRTVLVESTPGSSSWSTVATPDPIVGGDLWVQGNDVFLQSSFRDRSGDYAYGKRLVASTDGGHTWFTTKLPVPGLPCDFDQVDPPVLWERCATGMQSAVWISHDNGRRFRDNEARDPNGEQFSNGAMLAAASDTVAVVADDGDVKGLQRTADQGRTYRQVGPPGRWVWTFVGFTDEQHGVAIGSGRVFRTEDSGLTWHEVHVS